MFNEVIDLHMCSHQSLFVPVYAKAARRSCVAVVCHAAAHPPTQFPAVLTFSHVCYRITRSHVIAAVFKIGRDSTTISSHTLLNVTDSLVPIVYVSVFP